MNLYNEMIKCMQTNRAR